MTRRRTSPRRNAAVPRNAELSSQYLGLGFDGSCSSNFKEIAAKNAPCSAASTGSSALKLNAAPKGWIAILSIVGGQNLTQPLLMQVAAKSRVSAGSSQGGISMTPTPCG